VLIYDESGDHPALQAAEAALEGGAEVEVMTPDRTFAPEIMSMTLTPYIASLQGHARFTLMQRLLEVRRAGNRLVARIGTDFSERVEERAFDHVVVNYGTRPLDELYFDLREASVNLGEVDHEALIAGRAQAVRRNPEGRFQLFRIGDAVSSRNIHAAIYDALRLVKDL